MIVAGFGFRGGADLDALRRLFDLAQRGQPRITHLATPQDKIAALRPLADALGLPLSAIAPAAMVAAPTHTCSPASLKARGVGSVAEACALAAATLSGRPPPRLLLSRQISPDRMATCAIAQGYPQ
ncbi:cobalamin biosynthesis protein [Sphingobium sp.]|uniref:cobalamin biosynthesis protein n=1 Tax=Sphingobium sp. TaxID=1912891 RepID=UPI003BB50932